MTTPEFTREYIYSWILRRLGAPTLSVELTPDQINDCIDEALDEVSPWVVQPAFITVPVTQMIDLSSYEVDAAYIINVHKTDVGYNRANGSIDIFNPLSYFDIQSSRTYTYNALERILFDRTNQTLKDNISFKYIKPKLYLDIGYPGSSECVIEYSPSVKDVDLFSEDREDSRMYRKYLKGFSLAYARKILAEVRGKYTVDGSPVTLDADNQSSRADEELQNLRSEMRDTVSSQFIID